MTDVQIPEYAKNELDENALISWLKANYDKIEFMNKQENLKNEAHDRTNKLHEAINKLQVRKLSEQPEQVTEVWRYLVGKAIVYLKYRDNRENIHDDEDYGVETLFEFYKKFREFQPLLYGASEARYRDHIMHMLTVFLIGEYLIHSSVQFDSIDVGDKFLNNAIDKDEKEAMWCIIALTHDLGIPLERLPDINKKARDMLAQFEILNIEEISYPLICLPVDDLGIHLVSSDLVKYNKLASGENEKKEDIKTVDASTENTPKEENLYLTHVQSKYLTKFSEAFVQRDHGILGCLVLFRNLVYFLETDFCADVYKPLKEGDAKQFLIRRNILRAIASHNNDNIYHQRVLDFSFLLLLFDEFHEWARPRFLSMIEQKGLTTDVTVKELTAQKVHYQVEFTCTEGDTPDDKRINVFKLDILQWFIKKCNKYGRRLRSAVKDPAIPSITFTLDVIDSVTEEKTLYKFVHSTPQNVEMTIDDKSHSLTELDELVDDKKRSLINEVF